MPGSAPWVRVITKLPRPGTMSPHSCSVRFEKENTLHKRHAKEAVFAATNTNSAVRIEWVLEFPRRKGSYEAWNPRRLQQGWNLSFAVQGDAQTQVTRSACACYRGWTHAAHLQTWVYSLCSFLSTTRFGEWKPTADGVTLHPFPQTSQTLGLTLHRWPVNCVD